MHGLDTSARLDGKAPADIVSTSSTETTASAPLDEQPGTPSPGAGGPPMPSFPAASLRLAVRLPRAAGESDRGHLRRLAEANGYDKPDWLKPFVERRDTLTGLGKQRNAGDLIAIENGPALPKWRFDASRPKVCPECLGERSVLELAWEVGFSTVCPKHGCRLLCECPSCETPLSWERKLSSRCDCGLAFADAEPRQASPAEVALVSAMLADPSAERLQNRVGLAEGLHRLSATEIMTVVGILGTIPGRLAGKKSPVSTYLPPPREMFDIVGIAADALADWPAGFERLLETQAETLPDVQERGVRFALREVGYHMIYRFRGKKYSFLFEAYEHFLKGAEARLVEKLLAPFPGMCSLDELMREYRVSISTAKNWSAEMPRVTPLPWIATVYVPRHAFAARYAATGKKKPMLPVARGALLSPGLAGAALGLEGVEQHTRKRILDHLVGTPDRCGFWDGYPPDRVKAAVARLEALGPSDGSASCEAREAELDLVEICRRAGSLSGEVLALVFAGGFSPTSADASATGMRRHLFPEGRLRKALAQDYGEDVHARRPEIAAAVSAGKWWKRNFDPKLRANAIREMAAGRTPVEVGHELGVEAVVCRDWWRSRRIGPKPPRKPTTPSKLEPHVEWLRAAIASDSFLGGTRLRKKIKDELGIEVGFCAITQFVTSRKLRVVAWQTTGQGRWKRPTCPDDLSLGKS